MFAVCSEYVLQWFSEKDINIRAEINGSSMEFWLTERKNFFFLFIFLILLITISNNNHNNLNNKIIMFVCFKMKYIKQCIPMLPMNSCTVAASINHHNNFINSVVSIKMFTFFWLSALMFPIWTLYSWTHKILVTYNNHKTIGVGAHAKMKQFPNKIFFFLSLKM